MKKTTYFIWGLACIGILITCYIYPQIHQDIPIQWNTHGEVSSTAPPWVLFLMPLFAPFLDVCLLIFRRIDPKRKNYERFETTYQIFRVLCASFMFLFFIATILEIYMPSFIDIKTVSLCATGILISTIGNFMPKTKSNYFIGFRTPWTLMDDKVWIKTHRIAGRTWMLGGILFIIMAFAPSWIAQLMPYAIAILIVIYPTLYSYSIYRNIKHKGEQHD